MPTLTAPQFLVLVALLHYPMHPYAIRQEIIELTGRQVWPARSTVRRALDGLLKSGFIEEERRTDPYYWLKAKRGVPYELTETGYTKVRRELSLYHEVIVKSRGWLDKFDDKSRDSVNSKHVYRG